MWLRAALASAALVVLALLELAYAIRSRASRLRLVAPRVLVSLDRRLDSRIVPLRLLLRYSLLEPGPSRASTST